MYFLSFVLHANVYEKTSNNNVLHKLTQLTKYTNNQLHWFRCKYIMRSQSGMKQAYNVSVAR